MLKNGKIKNKIAVITGGARGLGEKIAETFYNEEAEIIICDILFEEAKKLL